MGDLEGHDPTRMRISDADRHKVAEVLREAAGQGRLDPDELDERLEATFSAKTYADLVPITVDLHPAPAAPPTAQPMSPYAAGLPGTAPRHTTSLAIMGGRDLQGRVGGGCQPQCVRADGRHRHRPSAGDLLHARSSSTPAP
ncbi:DUF1707 SHOCT-like domain-containing protein [Nocardioides sp. B-3]|uniref:DUF1707 SHOCT-like domain-containing protein n=1 Tax=Nocardioides sp. B-3 TaxID=2895565 RepID=UPI002153924F|nr:DUF1707 domain-containing protein [Nocardioides sp. B-3]UUZ60255.1 DUF1707 domain-containing protein [Nocardioides sp. B-3]